MSKQNRATKTQANKEDHQKTKTTSALESIRGQLILAEMSSGSAGTGNPPTGQDQAIRLGDTRLTTLQRQMLASQIGQVQGNEHLQRVMIQVNSSVSEQASAVIQRQTDGSGGSGGVPNDGTGGGEGSGPGTGEGGQTKDVSGSRSLTSDEYEYAYVIYQDSLDYAAITITRGSVAATGASRTLGNTIHLRDNLFEGDTLDLTEHGMDILIHEMAHVWQYQHQGWSYAPEALWSQFVAWWETGDRGAAYDWESLEKAGIPWEEWNPEAQAEAVEDYNKALRKVHDNVATKADFNLLSRLQPYIDKIQNPPPPPPAPPAGSGGGGGHEGTGGTQGTGGAGGMQGTGGAGGAQG